MKTSRFLTILLVIGLLGGSITGCAVSRQAHAGDFFFQGQRVVVSHRGGYSSSVVPAVQNELRARGATIIVPFRQRSHQLEKMDVEYVVDVSTTQQNHTANVWLRVIDRISGELIATGSGSAYAGHYYWKRNHPPYHYRGRFFSKKDKKEHKRRYKEYYRRYHSRRYSFGYDWPRAYARAAAQAVANLH